MNEEDKQRFARYRKGYVEPIESVNNTNDDNKLKNKQTLGYIEKIEVNTDSLVKEITKNTTNTINNTSKK
jgi:hypothetical protein